MHEVNLTPRNCTVFYSSENCFEIAIILSGFIPIV